MKNNQLTYKSFFIKRLFNKFFNDFVSIDIHKQLIIIRNNIEEISFSIEEISSCLVYKGKIFDSIILQVQDKKYVISGINKVVSKKIKRILYYLQNYKKIKNDFNLFEYITNGNHYVSASENEEVYLKIKNSVINDLSIDFFDDLKEEYIKYSSLFQDYLKTPDKYRKKNNNQFIKEELIRYKDFFDTVENQPLTERQRLAVITNEDNNLIVAGAGSGKTSVMVAKVLYLLDKGYIKPEELLVLAYNTKAKQELEQRLSSKIKNLPNVMTFHGLGNHILKVGNSKKILSIIATDNYKYNALIRKLIAEYILNSQFSDIIQDYFQEFFYPLPNIFSFKDEGEYWDYLESYEVRTLNNEKVKSIEECIIANFLYINGIKYTYEKLYKFDIQTPDNVQYHPDFYLDDYDIYIEHFAISRDCKTPPFIDCKKYNDGIRWKRGIHELNETTLIETYSYEKFEGNLLSNLKNKLKKHNVEFNPIDKKLLFEKLNNVDYIDVFSELLGIFLNHFKSNQLKIDALKMKLKSISDNQFENQDETLNDSVRRQEAFLRIFEPIFNSYEKNLKTNNEIDFNDMILLATKYHNLGLYTSPYKYILVDEFQDISQGRALLLKELLKEDSVKLCCVGDDWQSIYRFSGSDISIMQNFNKIFGVTKRIDLDVTFRFDNQINNVATTFITKNSAQLIKDIHTIKRNETPSVLIYYADKHSDSVMNVLHEIEQNIISPNKNNVLILSRFNKLKQKSDKEEIPFKEKLKEYQKNFKSLNISFSSVHGSKGLGFDYVILIDMNRGAFPLEKVDDPILDLVLPQKEFFPNAEERRLFYVALTRAKEKVYLIPDGNPSSFITELEGKEYNVGIYGSSDNPNKIKCPKCGTGLLIKSSTSKSFICSHVNYCDYQISVCNRCHKGFGVFNEKTHNIECFVCKDKKEKCPKCNDGYLVERDGKFGKFYGCSNYPKCTYTKDINGIRDKYNKYKNFENYR